MSYMTPQDTTVMLEPMPGLRWKLREFLDENDVSAYSVAKDTGLSLPSIYRLTNNHARTIQFNTLEAIMATLSKKTGKSVQLTDLLEFDPSDEPN